MSVVWIGLTISGFIVGYSIMGWITLHKHRKRTAMAVIVVIGVFLILYFGGAIHDASMRYARAKNISRNRAHTTVGREGYEYIFEPNTQIFIDKILPNGNIIITHIVLRDYLPFNLVSGCRFLDKDICTWMSFNVFRSYDQTPMILRLILYASIAALLTGAGFYLLSKPFINP